VLDPAQDPDRSLVLACRDLTDDRFETAFEAIYGRYRDRVYSIAYRMTGTATDAMDVVQEAFGQLFRKITSFRFDARFSTWLFRLVVNCCIDHRRRERSRMPRDGLGFASLETVADTSDPLAGPAESAEATELGAHVHDALQQLSPKLRAVLVLRYLEGLSYEELGQTLDVSLGTVKSRLARAHLALERVLQGTLERYGYPVRTQKAEDGAA
jgi:RNA polymerase sigma-70 factor (ECF subfamily)